MAGHSKWAQIKRQKGAMDKKRGTLFSKVTKLISVAARHGGVDPDANPRLRMLIDQARTLNMPKDTIERAIARGGSAALEDNLETLRFEIYGPGGVGILAEAATDNRNRTTAEVKAVLNKLDVKLAATGSVAYQFAARGRLRIPLRDQNLSEEAIELAIIESGAASYAPNLDDGPAHQVLVDPIQLDEVKQFLVDRGVKVTDPSFGWEPVQQVSVNESQEERIGKLIADLLELDDITEVSSNHQPEAA